MRESLRTHLSLSRGRPALIAGSHALRGRLERRTGQLEAALRAFEAAFLVSNDIKHLPSIGALAEDLGFTERALRAYTRGCGASADPRAAMCVSRDRLLQGAEEAPVNDPSPMRNP